ncbi:MAG: energy-coupling factor ABC transporter ATP-binding protein [Armatimonadetes bacterium]|nr:energy-coupling factor ABC transporter ATP-binding protein [Armatimonadota bacterium]
MRYPDGRLALNDISFLVEVGDSVAVLGANGAGKSTLLLALVGVLPAEGEIRFGEIVLSDKTLRDVRRKVQLVFQDPNDQLFMPLVRDDVAFGPLNFGVPKDQVPQLVDKSLEAVGLSGFGDRAPHNLSLGERKRAAIASVLACEPEVILLDEPSAGLDAPGRRQLFNLLRDFKATKLIATHDLVLAEELCSKAIVLKAGKLITSGPISSLLSNEMLLSDCGLK